MQAAYHGFAVVVPSKSLADSSNRALANAINHGIEEPSFQVTANSTPGGVSAPQDMRKTAGHALAGKQFLGSGRKCPLQKNRKSLMHKPTAALCRSSGPVHARHRILQPFEKLSSW